MARLVILFFPFAAPVTSVIAVDCRAQLVPQLGLMLVPVSVPVSSQLHVLQEIGSRDILKFLGIEKKLWSAARMFDESDLVVAIGGNVTASEAVEDWIDACLLQPLSSRKVDLNADYAGYIEPAVQDEDGRPVERLPHHAAVLDLDRLTQLIPDLSDLEKHVRIYGPNQTRPFTGTIQKPLAVGYVYAYAYHNHDNANIVQVNINVDAEEQDLGLLVVLLKAVEQEFFSWIRDVNSLAYYLSVSTCHIVRTE